MDVDVSDDLRLGDLEDVEMWRGLTLDLDVCAEYGVQEELITEWALGITLEGSEDAAPFDQDDYSSVKHHFDRAAEEIDRLTSFHKIFWYAEDNVPADLDICSSSLIIKNSRLRLVHDWTRAGLNEALVVGKTKFDSLDSFIEDLWPRAYMAGLDIQDCFLHWPIHRSTRRRLGVRHPWTGRKGVYLFLPPGLAVAPEKNENNVGELVRVAHSRVHGLRSRRFVDDLRFTNAGTQAETEDEAMLNQRLSRFKMCLEEMGVRVHSKPGKMIWASQSIEWVGWLINTVEMRVALTMEKIEKGLLVCLRLLGRHASGEHSRAKDIAACCGFLNFVAMVIRQAKPYVRALWQCLGAAKVFAAWAGGQGRFNPIVFLTDAAVEDLNWWVLIFQGQPQRPIHFAGGRAFLWHQRTLDLQAARAVAWSEGLLVVLGTDASGDVGWGIACGNVWKQGVWTDTDRDKSINWKELDVYYTALKILPDLLRGKLVYAKMDNLCAVHYVNVGTGRIPDLAALAKNIRLEETRLGVESVAVHIPGKHNVTPDALSRLLLAASRRDAHADRSLRKHLFKQIENQVGFFTLDGIADDFGYNAQCVRFRSPSDSFFEADVQGERIWLFPPDDLIYTLLRVLRAKSRARESVAVVLCLPERVNAPWFWMLVQYVRIARYVSGSDLFRERCLDGRWERLPRTKEPWIIVGSMSVAQLREIPLREVVPM